MSPIARSEAAEGKQEFRGVQVLRAVAALTVVAGHSTDFLLRANGTLPSIFRYIHGPAGVDIFFVISGFVMTVSARRLRTRPHPARLFLLRRVIRIVPLYWCLTIAKYFTAVLYPGLTLNGRPQLRELLLSLAFIPYQSRGGDIHPLIPVGWTLSFEMLFYVVFALAMTRRRSLATVLVPTLLLIAVLSAFRQPGWPIWTILFDPIVLEFLAGFAIAMLTIDDALPPRGMAVAFAVLGVAILAFTLPFTTPPIARPSLWGVGAGALVLGVVTLEPVLGSRLPRWALLLGDASFSIYLVQTFVFPVLLAALRAVVPAAVYQHPASIGFAMLLAATTCTALVGVAGYLWLEKPITGFLRRSMDAQRPEPVAPR